MKIDLSSALISIVDYFLPRFTEGKVLCATIRVSVNYRDSKTKVDGVFNSIHFAFYRPTNYTTVIMAVGPNDLSALKFNPAAKFRFTSDHDSCWKNDGVTSPLFNLTCNMVNKIKENGAPDLPVDQYSWFVNIVDLNILPGKILVDRYNDYEVCLELEKTIKED